MVAPNPGHATEDLLFVNRRPARTKLTTTLASLVVDTEEDFDWLRPVSGTPFSTACVHKIDDLQSIANAWGIQPTYLLSYPVLEDDQAVNMLARYHGRGECDLGLQLHTWVTPPLIEQRSVSLSFSGNLAAAIEEHKLFELKKKFVACFGFSPVVFRSGRYGISAVTARLLEDHGFEVDTSLAPHSSFTPEGGPDFREIDFDLFWFGERRELLEVPLCRSIVGWGRRLGGRLYPMADKAHQKAGKFILSHSRIAERVTLSPEGNEVPAMRRLINHLIHRGCRVLPLSFHSSSLAVGRNPYVRSKAELHWFYERLSAILAYLNDDIGCRFVRVSQLPSLMEPSHPR